MSEQNEPLPASSSDPPQPTWQPPIIEKTPPRPAPTEGYSWLTYNPHAKVIYVRDHDQANRALAALQPPKGPLGFDLEWRPTYIKGQGENPVALIQLANDNTIFLIQVTAMREFPSKLAEVLADPDIVKAGVGIQYDARKLFADYHVLIRNCVDLSLLAKTVDNARWAGNYNSPLGLARLIESYEYKLLPKGKTTRSNWEARLTPQQQEYASSDAHAGYVLYRRLEEMVPLMPSVPQSTWYSFNNLAGFLCKDDGLPWTAENPDYDPGPIPPPRELTEAQLARIERRKQLRESKASGASKNPPSGGEILGSFPSTAAKMPRPGPAMATSMNIPSVNQPTAPARGAYSANPSCSQDNRGRGGPYRPPKQRGRARGHEHYQYPRTNNTAFTNNNHTSFATASYQGPFGAGPGPSSSASHPNHHFRSPGPRGNRGSGNRPPGGAVSNNPTRSNRYNHRDRGNSPGPNRRHSVMPVRGHPSGGTDLDGTA